MKVKTTPEQYAAKMQRRKPAPKKGKSRKDHAEINRESNSALLKRYNQLVDEHNNYVARTDYTMRVLAVALKKAANRKTMYSEVTDLEYIEMAREAIEEETAND